MWDRLIGIKLRDFPWLMLMFIGHVKKKTHGMLGGINKSQGICEPIKEVGYFVAKTQTNNIFFSI